MSDDKGASRSGGMNIDSKLVRELAKLLTDSGLSEIEVEDGTRKIKVARQAAPAPVFHAAPAAPAAPPAAVMDAPAAPPATDANAVKSPMVGTVYLSSEPGSASFAPLGAKVKEGDTILIVEAMKVMNPITAPRGGTITAVLVENAQPVEYDQPLIVIA
jgi:acetyl-CoA carboxylase biotin carboxyl carrier protein